MWGQEVYGKFVALALNFALNVKLLQKIKFFMKTHILQISFCIPCGFNLISFLES